MPDGIESAGTRALISLSFHFQDIEIPTVNNVRNAELMGIILYNENNVLCIGPTGTGKTLTVLGKLSKNMHKKFICDFMCFSARTTANQTQVSILRSRHSGSGLEFFYYAFFYIKSALASWSHMRPTGFIFDVEFLIKMQNSFMELGVCHFFRYWCEIKSFGKKFVDCEVYTSSVLLLFMLQFYIRC